MCSGLRMKREREAAQAVRSVSVPRKSFVEKLPQNKHFVLVLFLLPGGFSSLRGGVCLAFYPDFLG
jgi:hypothetical protein